MTVLSPLVYQSLAGRFGAPQLAAGVTESFQGFVSYLAERLPGLESRLIYDDYLFEALLRPLSLECQ